MELSPKFIHKSPFSPSLRKTKKIKSNISSRNCSLIKSYNKQIEATTPLNQTPTASPKKSKNIINNSFFNNDGPYCFNHQCPNIHIINDLQMKIRELIKENEKMNQINKYIIKTVSTKNKIISSMSNLALKDKEVLSNYNNTFTEDNNQVGANRKNLLEVIQTAIESQKKKNKMKYITNKSSVFFKKSETEFKHQDSSSKFNYLKFLSKPKAKNANEHYDFVQNLIKNKTMRSYELNSLSVILSQDINVLKSLIKSESFTQTKKITKIKSEFVNNIQAFPTNKLGDLRDYITKLVNEYEQMIDIIIRVKLFMSMSIELFSTKPLSYSLHHIISNSPQLLQCQTVNIFLYDYMLNVLELHSSDTVRKRKFPITDGIVGYTFTKVEKQNIHDATSDDRFNYEMDKNLGFYTKTMLCYPLIANDNKKCLGVIQAINKNGNNRLFNSDDEEIMSTLAKVFSHTIQNIICNDNNSKFIFQLKYLISYSIEINHCNSKSSIKFISISEKVLGELGGVRKAQIVFVKKNKEENNNSNSNVVFIHYDLKNCIVEIQYNGLLKKCYEKKQMIITQSSSNDSEYDINVDLDYFSIITIPIMNDINGELLAIGQVGVNLLYSKENDSKNPLSINEEEIFLTFSKIAGNAITSNIIH